MRGTTAIGEAGVSQLFTKGRQRRQITVLVAFILVGAAVFGLWQAYLGFLHRQERLESHALDHALASARIVDRETAAAGQLLRSLSTSPALANGDLATFYEQMRAAAPSHTWFILNDATGQLLNTSQPVVRRSPRSPTTIGCATRRSAKFANDACGSRTGCTV